MCVGGFVSKFLVQSSKGQGGLARGMVLFVFGGGRVLVVKVYDTRLLGDELCLDTDC